MFTAWAFIPASNLRGGTHQLCFAPYNNGEDDTRKVAACSAIEVYLPRVVASLLLSTALLFTSGLPATAQEIRPQPLPSPTIILSSTLEEGPQGLPAVTQSELGTSFRKSIVGGAKLADKLDLKWERFSDSLRDEAKCDPRTNRRMFDNGKRRDGTPVGNPVLGALCTPEPLKEFDPISASLVLDAGNEAAKTIFKVDQNTLKRKQEQVQQLVGPAFSRAVTKQNSGEEDKELNEAIQRQVFNRDLYIQLRAFGELPGLNNDKEVVLKFERAWGENLLSKLAPNANRKDFTSPFPKPDDTENQLYDEGALLDALGRVSVALNKLQEGGMVGHWEISIPEDDDWNVVTIAVDDDISIQGQILARERQQLLGGSEVVALVRSAMDNDAKIACKMDTFFIDPTTTRQELYNPTQLLISLSDLGQ